MDWSLVINIVLAAAAIAAAITAIVQARAAITSRNDARKAQAAAESAAKEATELSRKATDAFIRQAEAQERANELLLESQPKPQVAWRYSNRKGVIYVLVNIGDKVARNVTISDTSEGPNTISVEEKLPRDVVPSDSIEMWVTAWMGSPRPRLRIEWTEDDNDDVHVDESYMILS